MAAVKSNSAIALASSSTSSNEDETSRRHTPEPEYGDDEEEAELVDREAADNGKYEMQRLVKGDNETRGSYMQGAFEDEEQDDELATTSRKRRTSMQSFELYTPDEERRVRRKLDIRLVLFVALLYLLSFLDRSNIGNAKVAGLMRDLQLNDDQFEWLLTAFYISYIAFEWMTIMYQIVPPHIYISLCVGAWGVLASAQALTKSWGGLLMVRALLGISEAAFVGIPFYLTFFFRREELALRTGLFISAAPLATTFASSLAYAIMGFASRTQIASWRLLFLLEGFPAVVVAIWCWSWIPDSPGAAWWLSARERRVAVLRLRQETSRSRSSNTSSRKRFSWHEVGRTLRDPKAYLTAAMFFCCNVAFSSMPVFLPTIVENMGFTSRSSQALSAPPFLLAFLVVLITALTSDRLRSRSVPLVLHTLLAMLGYIFLAVAGALDLSLTTLRYLAVFPICTGFFSAVTLIITWTMNNQASSEGKGTGMALLNIIGQCGPLVGTRIYPDRDAPYFVSGMVVCAVMMGLAAVLALVLRWSLIRENRRRENWSTIGGEGSSGDHWRGDRKFVYFL